MNPVSINANNLNQPQETPAKSALKNSGNGKSGKGGKQVTVSDKVTISEAVLSDTDKAKKFVESVSAGILKDPQAAVSALGKMEPANVENLLKGFLEG